MRDAEFDELHGGRELLPIEQAIYEAEGAERFARFHQHGRSFPEQVMNWAPVRAAASTSPDLAAGGREEVRP
ncbi:MAG: hypothetical protein DI563_19395 [Variovorax paradoxus]|uniref:Uncharacterized protein n=1 Tax=Variovorax paradoxus TaxID=34073 RepID=A0A2W5PVU0_VARPD|nr:MAG: hypothetical protein DI563_19395 [Variovorax paradoxus]